MNIILFEKHETEKPLNINDPRSLHILKVLKGSQGDSFDAGIINGKKGKAIVKEINESSIILDFNFNSESAKLYPIKVICGMCRTVSAQRIIKDLSSLGVSEFIFARTDKGERSYTKSRLWKNKEYEKYLKDGAEQAVSTRIPELKTIYNIDKCMEYIDKDSQKIALDNYESTTSLSKAKLNANSEVVIAIGSERGWSKRERDFFRNNNFTIADLGSRVLRTETACISAVSIVLSKLAFI